MVKRPPNLTYAVDDEPPLLTNLLLGLQHVFLITISLIFPVVIVRSIGGTPQEAEFMVSMSMLAAGVGTVLHALNRRGIGSGYLCPSLCGPSFLSASLLAANVGGLHLLFGMTSVAGLFEVLLSRWIHRLRVLFPPEVTGLVVAMVGISVIPTALTNFMGRNATDAVTEMPELLVAFVTLGTMVGISVWSRGKLRLYSVLVGMTIGYLASIPLGILTVDHLALFAEAPLAAVPHLDYFGWSFDVALLLPFMIAITCSTLKTIGDITTCQKINDADWRRTDMMNVGQGILADGLSAVFGGLVGTMGQSTSSSNIGLSIGTGATSRRIAFAIGGILVFLAFLPKLAMVFVVMPEPVMGATLIYSVSFMIIAGFQIIMSRMLDARRTFLVGIPLIMGLSVDALPGLYDDVPTILSPIFSSSLSLAAVLVVILNLIFRIGIAKRQRLVLKPGVDDADSIFNFMERQGAAWGARREVIYRAISATNELFEAVGPTGLAEGDIDVEVSFDELNLDVVARYRGEPPALPSTRPAEEELLREGPSATGLAGFMMTRYANSVRVDTKDGACRVRLHFDH
ncbi:MAG: solute carrier family 23 protein [Methanothrix sp.]|jgi:NCS2 family nucleobase:cation symporter-2|nr:solute carrier family 23 protein [Methanothrix sp.]NLX39539.1 purine/pyrimidine permease [Methanothrix sp.]OPX80127.1 MAG: uracil transporter [Methanosaeta sp. PtaB.Bin087]HPY73014.1 solute carrier family 23 protein [Methanothrix sp.]HQA62699.1 solute carrier family 23 protein [Methanothrix sp.]